MAELLLRNVNVHECPSSFPSVWHPMVLQNFLEKVGGKVIEGLARFIMQQLVIAVRPFPLDGIDMVLLTTS